jgi:hypothetical protein
MSQISFQDFLRYPTNIFRLIFWDPFVDFDKSSRWVFAIRSLYLLSMNGSMILGAVLELMYCFTLQHEKDMIVHITKSLPIAGEFSIEICFSYKLN